MSSPLLVAWVLYLCILSSNMSGMLGSDALATLGGGRKEEVILHLSRAVLLLIRGYQRVQPRQQSVSVYYERYRLRRGPGSPGEADGE